jgi:hypothetical protein
MERAGLAALVAGSGLAFAALPAAGQSVGGEEECRCVDRDGNEIESCTCIRAPRVVVEGMTFGPNWTRRAQIGVWVEASEEEDGAHISRVQEGGPADEAGIEPGDVVLEVNAHSLLRPLDDAETEQGLELDQPLAVQRFVRLVGQLEPGEEATLAVRRDGETRTLTITPEPAEPRVMIFGGADGSDMARSLRRLEGLERRARMDQERALRSWEFEGQSPMVWRFEGDEGARGFRVFTDSLSGGEFFFSRQDPCFGLRAEGAGGFALLGGGNCVDGVEFVDLNPELGEYFEATSGVLVTEVAEEATLGLRPGDVLLAVDGRAVESPGHALRILESYLENEEIRLRVMRQGREIEVLGRRAGG